MNISNYYWYFKSALTPKFCDDVIKYALSKKETMAKTGGFEEESVFTTCSHHEGVFGK